MKTPTSITLAVAAGLLMVGCSTGKISSNRVLNLEDRTWALSQRIPVSLAVVPAESLSATNRWEMQSISNLATNLIRTGLFKTVVDGTNGEQADLKVLVRKSYGVLQCGTGLPLTKATLGLFRDNVAYSYVYDFEFMSPRASKTLPFATTYGGIYRIGFWPARDDGFIDLLRYDLLQHRQEIESLANTERKATNP